MKGQVGEFKGVELRLSAIDDFANLLGRTEVMKQALKRLQDEPAHLLCDICREYHRTGEPVPDHRLQLVGYMAETALAAILSAGLIQKYPGGRLSLYSYEPTQEGLKQWERLEAEGAC